VAWWVARSAAELLTSKELTSVRECAGYDCGRLFMDGTKNRSRRWCDMASCGNRAKGRRHYERRKAAPRG
jgi:predicted RNA-binding Zn ribbon-like protein